MPTLQCPGCGKAVRFEGVAGVCPNCATVVRAQRSGDAAAGGASRSPSRARTTSTADLEALGDGPEVFGPAGGAGSSSGGGSGPLDPRLLYGIGAAVVLLVGFGLFEVLHTPAPTIPVATTTPGFLPGPAAPPPPGPPPPPAPPPPPRPVAATGPAVVLPAWVGLHPAVPELPPVKISDRMVEAALRRGVAYLKPFIAGTFDHINAPGDTGRPGEDGRSAAGILLTYALLHTGQALDDVDLQPSSGLMANALDRIRPSGVEPWATYGTALRCQALSLAGREVDREQLVKDQDWLVRTERDGAYTYGPVPDNQAMAWDGSNSQYGVLGVWATTDAGMSVPARYWQDVERHWVQAQHADGGWAYNATRDPTTTMTAAGVTTLCVAAEQEVLIATGKPLARGARERMLDPTGRQTGGAVSGAGGRVGRNGKPGVAAPPPPPPPPVDRAALTDGIAKGLAYLGQGDRLLDPGLDQGYTLYGIERAALATGFRYFGTHDWYRELGAAQLASQSPNGSWSGNYGLEIGTAFRLLFLARGRQPLLMDKLRFDGAWDNRPRDVAKLTAYVSQQLEKPFAWGVADLDRDWWDWLDAPLLYITTNAAPTFTDDDCRKLRSYSDAGGFIVLHNEFAERDVDAFAADLAKRVWPEYPLAAVPAGDLLYRTVFPMAAGRRPVPPLKAVSNGTRPLLVYSPTDLSRDWVGWRARDPHPAAGLQMGLNLFVAAAGKSDFRNRLDTPYIDPSPVTPVGVVPVQMITYPGGNCDPEPGAWVRFGRWFLDHTSVALDERPTDIKAVDIHTGPVAVLTGNKAVDVGQVDLHALRAFVSAGGTLLVDADGGDAGFVKSVHDQLLPAAFGSNSSGLPGDHPILAGLGPCMTPLPKPRLRSFAIEQFGLGHPPGVQSLTLGAGTVLVSDLDLTTALLHSSTYGILGYTPDYADALYKNAILWTLSRFQPGTATQPATGPATQAAVR